MYKVNGIWLDMKNYNQRNLFRSSPKTHEIKLLKIFHDKKTQAHTTQSTYEAKNT